MSEKILVVPGIAITWNGGRLHPYLDRFFSDVQTYSYFIERSSAETNPAIKQVIPYIIISDSEDRIFTYRRIKGAGEQRLHSKISVGIGGHINENLFHSPKLSHTVFPPISLAAWRELHEELHLPSGYHSSQYIGLIYDDSDEVGSVHVGVCIQIELEEGCDLNQIHLKEVEKYEEVGWLPVVELLEMELESWSRIALEG